MQIYQLCITGPYVLSITHPWTSLAVSWQHSPKIPQKCHYQVSKVMRDNTPNLYAKPIPALINPSCFSSVYGHQVTTYTKRAGTAPHSLRPTFKSTEEREPCHSEHCSSGLSTLASDDFGCLFGTNLKPMIHLDLVMYSYLLLHDLDFS